MKPKMTYSAIIVLGNLMSKSGKLNAESSSRMDVAIKAFHNKLAPFIVTCGWAYRDDSLLTIADAMKAYAIEVGGVPLDAILTEKKSRDTVGDAVFSKKNMALNRGWKRLLIVTSDYHVARTYEIFNFVYGEQFAIKVMGANTDMMAKESQSNHELKSIHRFQTTFEGINAGDDTLIYQCLEAKHPYYNGLVYPKVV